MPLEKEKTTAWDVLVRLDWKLSKEYNTIEFKKDGTVVFDKVVYTTAQDVTKQMLWKLGALVENA